MEKKFKVKLNKKVDMMLYIVIAICAVGLICDIAFMSLAIKIKAKYVAYIVSGVLLLLLLFYIAIMKFGSYYTIDDNNFVTTLCLIKKKVEFSDILNIRHDKNTNKTIMYYHTYPKNGDKLVAMQYINVSSGDLDTIVTTLKEKNNMIIYDVFNEEKSNDENQWFNNRK